MPLLGSLGYIENCKSIYYLLIKINDTSATHNSMIRIAESSGRMDLVILAYTHAVKSNQTEGYTHNRVIRYASEHQMFYLAKLAYNNSIISKTANVITHTTFIVTARHLKDRTCAEIAYNNAMLTGEINERLYMTFINGARENGWKDLLIKAYYDSIKNKLINNVILKLIKFAAEEYKIEDILYDTQSRFPYGLPETSLGFFPNVKAMQVGVKALTNKNVGDFKIR